MARKNANPNQIIRKDGNNCFVEVLRNSFEINRVLMKFVKYDLSREAGNKITAEIDIYMTFEKFLRLCYDILDSQSLIKAIFTDKQKAAQETATSGKKVYPKQRIIAQGGTSADSLKQKGKSRPDGMGESRVLKIFAGDKLPIILQAESGAGEADSKGLIIPRYGYNPEQKVMMALTTDDAKELFLLVRAEIQAYLTAKRMIEMMNPQQTSNQNTYNNEQHTQQPPTESSQSQNTEQTPPPTFMNAPETQTVEPDDIFGGDDMFNGPDDFFG